MPGIVEYPYQSREHTNQYPSRQALNADVPEGWVTGEGEGEYEGLIYYYNEATGESTWDHPLDEHYRCETLNFERIHK